MKGDAIEFSFRPPNGMTGGPLLATLSTDGETIESFKFRRRAFHRGIEKAMEIQKWRLLLPYCDRMDPENAVFYEIAFCEAVEKLMGLEIPDRAQCVRVLLSELSRVQSHLNSIIKLAKALGAKAVTHHILREREKIADLFELITGARFSFNYLIVGGIIEDVTDGFLERAIEVCDMVRFRLKEYNDVFCFNVNTLRRLKDVGILTQSLAYAHGTTGPNARGSGISMDYRLMGDNPIYKKINLKISLGVGDCYSRMMVRLNEISDSLLIIKQVIEFTKPGPHSLELSNEQVNQPAAGQAIARVESPRGLVSCFVASSGADRPERVSWRTPSFSHLELLPSLLTGSELGDALPTIASLDLSVAEADK